MPAGSTPIRVLLVEDDDAYARLLREAAHRIVRVDRPAARQHARPTAVAAIDSGPVDAVLLDLGLPDSFGLDTFERLHGAAGAVPIIVLTAQDDDAIAVQAVQRGAQDYLVKSHDGRAAAAAVDPLRARARGVAARGPRTGSGAAPGPQDGSGRAAGRRGRARFQQRADRDLRLRRPAARSVHRRRSAPRRRAGDPAIGRARRGADAAAAGVQPQADDAAARAEPERRDREPADTAVAPGRRRHRARDPLLRRSLARPRRPRADRTGADEPRRQRARRDARRRAARDRNRERRRRARGCPESPGPQAGRVRHDDRHRHGHGRFPPSVRPHVFEPFFTTKEAGERDGARPGDGLRDRQADAAAASTWTARKERGRASWSTSRASPRRSPAELLLLFEAGRQVDVGRRDARRDFLRFADRP